MKTQIKRSKFLFILPLIFIFTSIKSDSRLYFDNVDSKAFFYTTCQLPQTNSKNISQDRTFCDGNGNQHFMPKNEFEVNRAKEVVDRVLKPPPQRSNLSSQKSENPILYKTKSDFVSQFQNQIGVCYNQTELFFLKADYYVSPGYKDFIRELPGYEEFICDYENKFKQKDWRKKYRKAGKRGGLERWKFVEYIRGEYKRILSEKRAYDSQMQNIRHKAQAWQNSLNAKNEQIQEIEVLSEEQELDLCKNVLSSQKEELLVTQEEHDLINLGLKFANQAKDALDNKQTKDFIRYKRRVEILEITVENPYEQTTQSHFLTNDSCTELTKAGVNSDKFKTLVGNQAQRLLICETVEIINGASNLKNFYSQERQIISITNLIYKTSDLTYTQCVNHNLELGFALSDFGNKLLEIGEKYTALLSKAIEINTLKPETFIDQLNFDYFSQLVYEEGYEEVSRKQEEINRKWKCTYEVPARLKYKHLTIEYISTLQEASKNLSEVVAIKSKNLESFKDQILPLDETPEGRCEESYIFKASQNIEFVAKALFPNSESLFINNIVATSKKEMEIARYTGGPNMQAVYAPTKEVFSQSGKILKDKATNFQQLKRLEIEAQEKEVDLQEEKRKSWFDKEKVKLADEEIANQEFELARKEEIQNKIDFEERQASRKISRRTYDYIASKFKREEISLEEIELKTIEKELKKVISSKSSDVYEKTISNLGLEFIDEIRNLSESEFFEDFIECQIAKDRVEAVMATVSLDDGRAQQSITYELSNKTVTLLRQSGLKPELFSDFTGDHLQRYLHAEIVEKVNETSDLLDAHIDNLQITGISTLIYQAANEAIVCNQNKEIERSFALADFCVGMLEYGNQIGRIIAQGADISLKTTMAVGKGAGLGIYNSGKFALNSFIHPIDSTKDFVKGTGTLLVVLPAKAVLGLSKAALLACKDQEEFIIKFKKYRKKASTIASALASYIGENPYEALTQTVAFVTEFIVVPKLPLAQNIIINKSLGKLARIIQKEAKLSKSITDPNLRKSSTAVTNVIQETGKIIEVGVKEGLKNTKAAIKELTQNKFLIDSKDIVPVEAVEVLSQFRNNFPRQNLKHSFCGEIRKGKLKGFHHARNYPERIQKVTKNPNQHGIYEAIYSYMGNTKKSTFFPNEWNRIKIMQKVNEAFRNPIEKMTYGIIGKTIEGIEVKMWFAKLKSTGEIIIDSNYPIL